MPFRWFDIIRLRARSLVLRERVEAELDRELRSHLEYQIEENLSRGMTAEQARYEALRTFGGVDRMKEEARDARSVSVIENVARDLRYTLRGLRHDPMLLVAAATSIALGVGGNLAVYTLAQNIIFTTPHVRDVETLVRMEVSHGSHASYQRWLDLDASGSLASFAGYSIDKQINWFDGDRAVSLTPMVVTANFFDVVGLPLAFGRGFSAAEARAERNPRMVVVSHAFWQNRLGGDSAVLGRSLVLNGESYAILGVLAPRLRSLVGFGIAPSVYVPLSRAVVPELDAPDAAIVALIGRLKPGQSLGEARAAVHAADRRLGRLEGDTVYSGVQEFERLGGLNGKIGRAVQAFFGVLAVVSVLVLMIACANVAGLLIARSTTRRREIAIRLALGGTRGRLLQQLLVEGFWLALLGTAIGVALSVVFMRLVNGVTFPVPLPIELDLAPDASMFTAALGLVLISMMLCALLPALTATRVALSPALKREEPSVIGRKLRLRGALLIGQVTVSTLLLVTAFLFVRNLGRSQSTNPGFEVQRSLVAQLGLDEGRSLNQHIALLDQAVERVRAVPGVEHVAYSRVLPLTPHSGSSNGGNARIDGRAPEHVEYALSYVGPGFFSAMSIRLVQGREFANSDDAGAARVGIINEEFARKYFGSVNPVGRRVQFTWRDDAPEIEIVGVVSNIKHTTIGEEQRPALYQPVRQYTGGIGVAFILARTRADPATLATSTRQAIGELDRSVAVEVSPMRAALAFALLPSQVGAIVLGTLGGLGLLLAMFGLYAMIAYTVSRRVGEIAIRTALGATQRQVVSLVIRDASLLVGVGVLLGLGIAAFVTQPLATFLVTGLSATDPLSFVATALAFVMMSAFASWLPAIRATRVSPALAMRLE
jgi:putative ABC transport system permease protein